MNSLFTIGHSAHTIDAFINLLMKHRIDAVADVRSQPYSRHYPWFSRAELEQSLKDHDIRYVFLGRELGARRDEPECYVNHAVDYDRIAATGAFREGLDRLQKGLERFRIALMCAEKDPLDCHRTILVARHAIGFSQIQHILADGSLESHQAAEERLLRRFDLENEELFRTHDEILKLAYQQRGREIAYVEPNQP